MSRAVKPAIDFYRPYMKLVRRPCIYSNIMLEPLARTFEYLKSVNSLSAVLEYTRRPAECPV